jgi:hypothetical protein
MIDDIRNAYLFTTNQGDKIEVRAWFEEEAIIKFQKNHQRIGPKYYHPVVFTAVERVSH